MPTDWDDSDIAIIGMAGRFPGATNIDDFRRNLLNGVESVKFFADEELKASGIDPGLLRDPQYVKAAACLDGVETFDAEFFGYNPNEAALMDPQHRILLECAWSALEHAGYDALTYRGTVGVFAGATVNTYLLLNVAANPDLLDSLEDIQINIANAGDFLTTRISYKLNLRGPSHVVQSACSTSLVAVHVACQSLLNEECDLALAGGVSVNEKLKRGYRYIKGGMMSPDGRCRAFDAGAQGTIFGSGVGLVVLKRMKEAIADRDSIQAVIKGSAINNDGSLKVGYVAPSVEGQARVITEALAVAGIEPHTVSYIEAHGTGTPLGDPIEIQALTKAFTSARKTDQKWKCAVGSVKTNIGHLDAAAGAAGLIKTVIALKEKLLPPSLNFEKPNPQINFDAGPFYVNQTLKQWETDHWPRRAGVSAFGVGGTNAHVVLEEAPQPLGSESTRLLKLLILSAKSVSALDHACANLKDYLRTQPEVNMDDLAYTLQLGRHAFDHRCMFVCRDARDAVGALEHSETKAAKAHEDAGEDERIFRSVKQSGDKKIAFAFPGQGVRYRNIGRGLYLEVTSFRKQIDLCDEILQPLLGRSLKEFLYPPQGSAPEPSAEPFLQNTEADVIQPALFALEYATAKLWMSWGVRPSAMIGHSLGEYVAACIAGVVTLEDALSLVTARGKLMRRLPAGSMLGVNLSEEEAHQILESGLSLAAVNGLSHCVISGPEEGVERLNLRLASAGVVCWKLRTLHAFHSAMMEPILEEFTALVDKIRLNSPHTPYISNVTGTWIKPHEPTTAEYWARHLRQTVKFYQGAGELLKENGLVLLEVGPGQTLSKLFKHNPKLSSYHSILASFSGLQDDGSDQRHALTVLGKLWLAGAEIDWPAFYENECRRRVNIPTYPFERRRYWLSPRAALAKGVNETLTQPVNPDAPLERAAEVNAVRSVAFRPRPTLPHPYVAAGNDLEKKIISVWRRILGVDPIGTQDNFFDLGGDSLLAIQTIEQLRKELNMEIPIVSLYESVTVKSLVEILQSTNHVHGNEGHDDRSRRRKQSIDKQRTRKSKG